MKKKTIQKDTIDQQDHESQSIEQRIAARAERVQSLEPLPSG
jgi:hypothetical protein